MKLSFQRVNRLLGCLKSRGLATTIDMLKRKLSEQSYARLSAIHDTMSPHHKRLGEKLYESLSHRPRFSVLLPVYDPQPKLLREAIASVLDQWYPDFELCIVDDASTQVDIREVVQEFCERDPRIRMIRRHSNGHISAASNTAASLASGEFVVPMDHDDIMRPHALLCCALEIEKSPRAKLLFSDEDKIDAGGERFAPHRKPGWDRTLLRSQNYLCHLTCIKRSVLPPFRIGVEGAQDWDLLLRITETLRDEEICHIPAVLYHWRAVSGSTALAAGEKPYVRAAQVQVIREHYERLGVGNVSVLIPEHSHRVQATIANGREDATVCCFVDLDSDENATMNFESCLEALQQSPVISIVVITHDEVLIERIEHRKSRHDDPSSLTWVHSKDFNRDAIAHALRLTSASHGVLLRRVLLPHNIHWIHSLLSLFAMKDVGTVAPRILDRRQRVFAAGIRVPSATTHAGPEFTFRGLHANDPGYLERAHCNHEYLILPGYCLLFDSTLLSESQVPNTELPLEFELCHLSRELGRANVFSPMVSLLSSHGLAHEEAIPSDYCRQELWTEVSKHFGEDPYAARVHQELPYFSLLSSSTSR